MDNSRRLVLGGAKSEVAITCDHNREWTSGIPMVCSSSPRGFVRLPDFISGDPRRDQILSVADWMSGAKGGAFVTVFPSIEDSRGLALIQADHDGQGSETFYQRHHRDSPGIWKDYYFQAVFTALSEGDALWVSEEVQIAHPTNGGWDLELITVVLEAIRHLADRRELNVKIIHLDCLHGDHSADFKKAHETLKRERVQSDVSSYRDFEVRRETDHFEAQHPGSDGALFWMPLRRQERPTKDPS